MGALIAFAFLAGAATALSPCVLPVLPVALSAGVTGGQRRPLGVVTGLVLSFTVDPGIVLGGVAVGLATALIFGLLPIVQAAGVRPTAVLRELPEGRTWRTVLASISSFMAYCTPTELDAWVITMSASSAKPSGRTAT